MRLRIPYIHLLLPLIFCCSSVTAQNFADQEFYLIDHLDIDVISNSEMSKLDSCLTVFHSDQHDTIRLGALSYFIEECWDDNVWPRYNRWLNNHLQKLTEQKWPDPQTLRKIRSLYALSLNNIGYHLSDFGEIAEAIVYYERGLKIRAEIDDKDWLSESLKNLASIYSGQGDIPKALEYYRRNLKMEEELGNQDGIAESLNFLAVIHSNQGNIPKALDYYQRSLMIYQEIENEQGIAESLNYLAEIYSDQGEDSKALEYYQKSLKIKEELRSKKGNAPSHEGEISSALEYYQRSLKLDEEIGNDRGITSSLNNLASMYADQGDIAKALEYYQRSLKIQEGIGSKSGIALVLNNLAKIYTDQGDISKALEFHQRSLNIKEEIGNKDGIALSLTRIGSIYAGLGDADKTKQFGERSLVIAQELGYPTRIKNASKLLSDAYATLGDHKKAFEMHLLYTEMRDSLNNEDLKRTIMRQQFQEEYEKQTLADSITNAEMQKVKDARILAQDATLKGEKNTRYALFGGLGLASIFSMLMYNRFRHTRKQKNVIELQKQEVEERKEQFEQKNREILESINYAKQLQTAVLPPIRVVKEFFAHSFLIYLPSHILSGDFYWMERKGDFSYFAVADCTGHGVPGAMLSIIGLNGLNHALNQKQHPQPREILTSLSNTVNRHFERSDSTVRDGMDICLCALNNKTLELTYAGANNPVWIARNGEMIILKADRRAIGHDERDQEFTQQEMQLQKGDTLYLSTDGYHDQFGGDRFKKLKTKVFRSRLLEASTEPMERQRDGHVSYFENWKGDNDQTDDVCVMGIRI
jgi:serine phosphatase RsbU (regulator of sigma subunit)/Tfp pilus assembly protein PilF